MIFELLKLNDAVRINMDARLDFLKKKFADRLKFELKQQRARLLVEMDGPYGTRSETAHRLFDEPETIKVIEDVMRKAAESAGETSSETAIQESPDGSSP